MSVTSIFSSFSAMGSGGGGSEWQEADSDSSSSYDECNDKNKTSVKGKTPLMKSGPKKTKKQHPSHKPSYRNDDDDDDDEDDNNNIPNQKDFQIKHAHPTRKASSLLGSQQDEDDDIDSEEDERHQRYSRRTRKHEYEGTKKSGARNHGCGEGSKLKERSNDGAKTSLRRHRSDDGNFGHRAREEGSVRRTRSCNSVDLTPKDEQTRMRGRRTTRDLDVDDKSVRSSSRSVASRSISRSRGNRLQRARSKCGTKPPRQEKNHASLLGNDETSDDDEPESLVSPKSKRSGKPNLPDLTCNGEREPSTEGRRSKEEHSQRGRKTLDLAQKSPRKMIRGCRSLGEINSDHSSPRKSIRGHRSINDKFTDTDQNSPRKSIRGRCSLEENSADTGFNSPRKFIRGQRSLDESSVRGRRSTLANGLDGNESSQRRERSVARTSWREKEKVKSGENNEFDILMDEKADAAKRDASRQDSSASCRNGYGRSMSSQRNSRQCDKTTSHVLGSLLDDKSENDDEFAYEEPNHSKCNGSGGYLPSNLGTKSRRNGQPSRNETGADDRKISLREIIKAEVLNNDEKDNEKEGKSKILESRSFRSRHGIFGK